MVGGDGVEDGADERVGVVRHRLVALPRGPQLGGEAQHLGADDLERPQGPRPQLGRLHVDPQRVAELLAVERRIPVVGSPVAVHLPGKADEDGRVEAGERVGERLQPRIVLHLVEGGGGDRSCHRHDEGFRETPLQAKRHHAVNFGQPARKEPHQRRVQRLRAGRRRHAGMD